MNHPNPALAAAILHDRLVAEALAAPLLDLDQPLDAPISLRAPHRFCERAAMLGGAARVEAVWRFVWQGTPNSPSNRSGAERSLLAGLTRHASERLRRAGAVWVLHADAAMPARELLAWRWLSLRLPATVLTLLADADLDPLPPRSATHVRLLDPALAPSGKTAHLHLHDGANFGEPGAWAAATNPQRHESTKKIPSDAIPAALKEAGIGPNGYDALLRVAGLLERDLMMQLGVAQPRSLALQEAFDAFRGLLGACDGAVANQAQRDAAAAWLAANASNIRAGWGRTQAAAQCVGDQEPDESRRALFRHAMRRTACMAHPARRAELLTLLRLRALLHDHLVHDPAYPALAFFVTRFRRAKWYEKLPDADNGGTTSACPEADLPALAAVELRDGPKSGPSALTRMRKRRDQLSASADDVERTVITHFLRSPRLGKRAIDDHRDALKDAEAMASALESAPELAHTYRGVDLAGNERGGPLLLYAAALRCLRDAIDRASTAIGVRGAGVTIHAGEDFDCPWTGLRAIDECFLFDLLRPGDRIGHATILSRPIADLAAQGPLLQPRLERMLDLMWLLHRSGCDVETPLPASTAAFRWQAELARHLQAVDAKADVGEAAVHFADAGKRDPLTLHDAPAARLFNVHAATWLARWLDDDHRAFATVVPVRFEPEEVDLAEATRLRLLQRIAASRIAVEANPTSNLLLAGHSIPLEQPTWRAHPLAPCPAPTIAITLSTDDPIQFATSLADEIAYAWAGGVIAGASPEHMRALIEQACRNAWAFRFGLDAPRRS
jgi:hypothetical protein